MRYVELGRDNLRSHFVFRPRHAPEWLRARFLQVIFLANEEELTGKTFTTPLNTTNPNTYVKFIFLRTSPLTMTYSHRPHHPGVAGGRLALFLNACLSSVSRTENWGRGCGSKLLPLAYSLFCAAGGSYLSFDLSVCLCKSWYLFTALPVSEEHRGQEL